MTTLRQILTQADAGISIRKITANVGKDRNTVRDYLRRASSSGKGLQELLALSDEELGQALAPEAAPTPNSRLEVLKGLFPDIERELKRVGVTLGLLWEEYKGAHPEGYGYSQFCHHFRSWRGKQDVPMHFEHKAGEKVYIDFAGKKLHYVDWLTGEQKEAEVFVATLGASQYTYVEACESQKLDPFLNAVQNALHFFDGVPQGIVPDNLKSAITQSDRYEPKVNESFEAMCNHYGMAPLPARPRRPRDKPLVEKAVDIAYKRIYARMRNSLFHSLDELNKAISELLPGYNDPKFQNRDYSRTDLFEQVERPALKPLPQERYEIKRFAWATVQKNSHVRLKEDKHFYSVPYRYQGEKVKIAYGHRTVEIYLKDKKIAFHRRNPAPLGYSSIEEHLPSNHRFFIKYWNPGYFLSQGLRIGEQTRNLIQAILDDRPHPEQAYNSCMGILRIAKKYEAQRVNDACQRALDYRRFSYRTVKTILEKGLDKNKSNDPPNAQTSLFPDHENIRGKGYYE